MYDIYVRIFTDIASGGNYMKKERSKLLLVMLLCITMIGTTLLSACGKPDPEEPEPPASNSLTGATAEQGYDEAAAGRRVAAFVVENAPDARPQWGMDDENYSPDIILQGEVEGGITRTLWLYADYEKLPEIIGPTRSARPPFVKFSELFDSIFIHWGMSHSKGDYIGAKTVFKRDKVDHIDQMYLDDQEGMYGRDTTRAVNVEHRGIIYGEKVPATIKNEGFRTEPKEYTKLAFNRVTEPVSETAATQVGVKYSEKAFEDTYWTYSEEDGMYHTSSFENDLARENLLVLSDETEYITKEGYQGPGSAGSVTYCDYKLKGGDGKLFSKGTVKDIKWQINDGKLELIDPATDAETAKTTNDENLASAIETVKADENAEWPVYNKYVIVSPEPEEGEELSEEEALANSYVLQNLNVGKTWIGWISSNNGGKVSSK